MSHSVGSDKLIMWILESSPLLQMFV